MRFPAGLLALLLLCAGSAVAHEVRPGYLNLKQAGPERFDVVWKVPVLGNLRLALAPRLPEACRDRTEPLVYRSGGAEIRRWSVRCPAGLIGRTVAIDGLTSTLTDVLVRVERSDGSIQSARLTPSAPSFEVTAAPGWLDVAGSYFGLGVEHILLGPDHLLFVLALLLIVRGTRRLVATITAFTVAHSITLALATLGILRVPGPPVEAVIALSIVFVAAEIVQRERGRPALTARAPWMVAFAFGLLHGLGFAGALAEIGLPENAIPLALLFFNIGVEVGQLLFVAAVLALGILARRLALAPPRAATLLAAYAIGGLSAYWMIERVAGFWA